MPVVYKIEIIHIYKGKVIKYSFENFYINPYVISLYLWWKSTGNEF